MQSEKIKRNDNIKDDVHIIKMWTPFKIDLTNYRYVRKDFIFNFKSFLLYLIAIPIVSIFDRCRYNFKIVGKEKLKKIKTGKITISNHIHPMDCTMVAQAVLPKKVYFLSLKENFEIPLTRKIIRLLNAIPIPTNRFQMESFAREIYKLLENKKTIHIYPEGSLWPYEKKIREFKNGAFRMAVDKNVPIVPMVFIYKEVQGIRSYTKKKPFIELHILDPIYPDKKTKNKRLEVDRIKELAHKNMEEYAKIHNDE